MNTNYTFKSINFFLAIIAITLSTTMATAQTATVYEDAVLHSVAGVYTTGIVITSGEIAIEGVTFKIRASVTLGGNATEMNSNGDVWGVGEAGETNRSDVFEGDEEESATINSLTIINFVAGGTGYTENNISNLHFHSMNFRNAKHATDMPTITVNGTNPGTDNLGKLTQSFNVIFGVEFDNKAASAATFTVGDDSNVTSITIENGSVDSADVFNVSDFIASYTFNTVVLSVDDISNTSFKLYPNPVKDNILFSTTIYSVRVLNMAGKVVKVYTEGTNKLNVSDLVSGIYVLKGVSEEGTPLVKRFVK